MTLDYGSAVYPYQVAEPYSWFRCVGLRNGQVKLLNFRATLLELRPRADAIPVHRPKQHIVCLHHFDRPIERSLDGRNRRENSVKGDIAFLPADAPAKFRFGSDDPQRVPEILRPYLISKVYPNRSAQRG
jgi:hypothetical protein